LYFTSDESRKPSTMTAAGSVRHSADAAPAVASLDAAATCPVISASMRRRAVESRRLSSSRPFSSAQSGTMPPARLLPLAA
jgi:hypothetical protein